MTGEKLEALLGTLTKDVIILHEAQGVTSKNIDRLMSTVEHLTEALSPLDVIQVELKHIKNQLDKGAPTIKECDTRGKLVEEKVKRLESVVYSTVGLLLTSLVTAGLIKLLGD